MAEVFKGEKATSKKRLMCLEYLGLGMDKLIIKNSL